MGFLKGVNLVNYNADFFKLKDEHDALSGNDNFLPFYVISTVKPPSLGAGVGWIIRD